MICTVLAPGAPWPKLAIPAHQITKTITSTTPTTERVFDALVGSAGSRSYEIAALICMSKTAVYKALNILKAADVVAESTSSATDARGRKQETKVYSLTVSKGVAFHVIDNHTREGGLQPILSRDQVDEIRASRAAGIRYKELEIRYRCTRTVLSQAANGTHGYAGY